MESPMTFWFILIGVVILVAGMLWIFYRIGINLPPEEVSHAQPDERLLKLNRKIRFDVHETLMNTRCCLESFSIMQQNRYDDMPEPEVFVVLDRTWRNVQEHALSSARTGYRDCERLLRIRPDSSVLSIREAFLSGINACMECPLLSGQIESISECPISGKIKNEVKLSEVKHERGK